MPYEFNTQALQILEEIEGAFVEHQVREESRTGAQHPCGEGCAACCYGPFDVGRADLMVLLEAVAALPRDVRAGVLERIRDSARRQRRMLNMGADDPVDIVSIGDEALDATCDMLVDAPCPLLDEEKQRCLVYNARPQPCRLRGARWQCGQDELDFSCPIGLTDGHALIPLDIIRVNDRFAQLEARANLRGLPRDRTTIALGLDKLLRAAGSGP